MTRRRQTGSQRHEYGWGVAFRYGTLGPAIFRADGSIDKGVTWDDLARHIWFSETHNPWTGDRTGTCLGEFNDTSYHLFYNGIGGNTFGPAQNCATFLRPAVHSLSMPISGQPCR